MTSKMLSKISGLVMYKIMISTVIMTGGIDTVRIREAALSFIKINLPLCDALLETKDICAYNKLIKLQGVTLDSDTYCNTTKAVFQDRRLI